MSIKTLVVMLLAVICGVSAAWSMHRLQRSSVGVQSADTEPIAVAAVEIARGRMITDNDVPIRQWPKGMLPKGALTKIEDVIERSALTSLTAGEPLLDGKLASKGAGRGLAPLIPKGMRAYTVQTSGVASNVAGFVLPGNRVDVLLTLKGGYRDATGGGSAPGIG